MDNNSSVSALRCPDVMPPPDVAMRMISIVSDARASMARAAHGQPEDDGGGGGDGSGDNDDNDDDDMDDTRLPHELFPRIAVASVYNAQRVYVLLRHAVLPDMLRVLPGIERVLIEQLQARLDAAMRLGRYSLVTLTFWWLYTQWEPFRHMVQLSERQHGVASEEIELLTRAFNVLMFMVRTSAFEPHNAYGEVVGAFYALAVDMAGTRNRTLMELFAATTLPEKVTHEMKAAAAAANAAAAGDLHRVVTKPRSAKAPVRSARTRKGASGSATAQEAQAKRKADEMNAQATAAATAIIDAVTGELVQPPPPLPPPRDIVTAAALASAGIETRILGANRKAKAKTKAKASARAMPPPPPAKPRFKHMPVSATTITTNVK